MLLIEA